MTAAVINKFLETIVAQVTVKVMTLPNHNFCLWKHRQTRFS